MDKGLLPYATAQSFCCVNDPGHQTPGGVVFGSGILLRVECEFLGI